MLPVQNYAVSGKKYDRGDDVGDFPTPVWATRALMEKVLHNMPSKQMTCLEPACNRGYMSKPLADYFGVVIASDKYSYGDNTILDFLTVSKEDLPPVDFVITNPPFGLAQQFIEKGLEIADKGVAVLVRTSFLEGKKRFEELYIKHPPALIAQFTERVPMIKGRLLKSSTTATSYCWLVFTKTPTAPFPTFVWIPPCRKQLERDGDYEPEPEERNNGHENRTPAQSAGELGEGVSIA